MTGPAAARVLILGGTAEARALAATLVDAGLDVVSSLAGRVADPALPAGSVRIGGFGGSAGLANYVRVNGFAVTVDATHPFATTISANAVAACALAGVPLLRLARPGWVDHSDAPSWQWVDSYAQAAAVPGAGSRVFLTTGRTTLASFHVMTAAYVLVRLVEPINEPLPGQWRVIESRGPYSPESELALLSEHRIDLLITKDSGGPMTAPKLSAAAAVGARVVVVRRPTSGPGGPSEVSAVSEAAAWVLDAVAHGR